MESFLLSLSPSVREEVRRALAQVENGEGRLEQYVSAYIDDNGDWPTERYTADYLARGFLHQLQTSYGALRPRYGAPTKIAAAAAAGAAVNLTGGGAAIILGSVAVTTYGMENLAYQASLNPYTLSRLVGIYNRIAVVNDWRQLGFAAPDDNFFMEYINTVIGKQLEQQIRRELTGVFAHYAWRGARSALPHTDADTIGDRPEEVPWVENYMHRFINYQIENTHTTARRVAEEGLREGLPPEVIGSRLRRTFGLSPRYAQAVDNYEKGLLKQKVPRGRVSTLVNRYVEKLRLSRLNGVVNTESMTLYNLGRERHWQQAIQRGEMPMDTVKMWVTAKDELVCKVCRPMDGQTVALGESFIARTGNVLVPTVHPNCRCLIVPVRNVADVSGKEFVFPVSQRVTKHMGGKQGTKPHPSGSPQTVHAGGEETKVIDRVKETWGGLPFVTWFQREKEQRKKQYRSKWETKIYEVDRGVHDIPTRFLDQYRSNWGFRFGQNAHVNSVANSILDKGFTVPITVHVYNDTVHIWDGNHRLEAAYRLGLRTVPAVVVRKRGNLPDKWKSPADEQLREKLSRRDPPVRRYEPFPRNESHVPKWAEFANQMLAKRGEGYVKDIKKAALTPGRLFDEWMEYEEGSKPSEVVETVFLASMTDRTRSKAENRNFDSTVRQHVMDIISLGLPDEFWMKAPR